MGDHVAGAAAEQRRQPGDELLGPDNRQHVVGMGPHTVLTRQPADGRLTQPFGTHGERVARRVRSRRERLAHRRRYRVHRRANREVHYPAVVRARLFLVRREEIPREPRQPLRQGQCSSPCGGSADTIG